MATEEKLKIVISADNAEAVASLNQLATDLKRFEKGVKDATNGSDLLAFNKGITETKAKMEVLNASLNPLTNNTKNLAVGGNQAAQALTNVGRVAQDLPFGFMGIQNNLNPLLESFQRLKAETGSGTAALKALGSSLIGAGGLGLALSLASSAFLIYQNGIMGFNKKTQEAKDAVTEFTDSGVLKAVSSVRELSTEIELAKKGIISKDGVINHYNETIGKTTGLVNDLNEAETQLKNNAPDYIKMQLAKAAANLALADASKLELEIAELQLKKSQEFGKSGKFGAGITMAPGFIPGQAGDQGAASRAAANEAEKKRLDEELKKKLKDKISIYEKFAKQYEELMKSHPEWNFFDDNTKTKEGKGITSTPNPNNSKQAPVTAYTEWNTLISSRNELLDKQINLINRLQEAEKQKDLQDSLKVNKNLDPTQKNSALAAYDEQQNQRLYERLSLINSIQSAQAEWNMKMKQQIEIAEGVGNAISHSLQAMVTGKNPFEALTNALKQLIIDLAIAQVKLLAIRTIITLLNPGAKIGGIVAGVIGGVAAHAEGGVTTGPSIGMIGEAGPEAILPLDRFKGFVDQAAKMGAMTMQGNGGGNNKVEFEVRGNSLVAVLERTNHSLNFRR
jgi:hypothetical protein